MVEQMKFLSITGPKDDIDRVIENYIMKYDIQLENALVELKNVKGLQSFTETTPYKDSFATASELKKQYGDLDISTNEYMDIKKAAVLVEQLAQEIKKQKQAIDKLDKKIEIAENKLTQIEQFVGLEYDVSSILHFNFIKYRFGRFTKDYYTKFMEYIHDDIDSIFCTSREVGDYVWGVYFVPVTLSDRIDSIYSSMHFERFFLSDDYEGTPQVASDSLKDDIEKFTLARNRIKRYISDVLEKNKADFIKAYSTLKRYIENFDIRKMAALTKHDSKNPHVLFYILCGWMSAKNADSLRSLIEKDKDTFCFVEEKHSNLFSIAPTKLNNFVLFKPFELFIEMYGLPSHNEIDPTPIVSVFYAFLFGFMFGDLGQGAVLCILGLIISKWKKSRLASIVSVCGISSMIFGCLFGSLFGFEDVIPALWLRPGEAMSDIPLVGSLNTVFIVAIGIGCAVILFSMVLNIINRVKSNEYGEALFDTNGVAGIVFYASAVSVVLLFLTKQIVLAFGILIIMFVIPLLLIFFKEPLTHLIEKKAKIFPDEKGMFFVQGFFELFEVLLSYFSNTLSFVRVGAFAISHAAMMEVVLLLSGATGDSSSINWIGIILGNIFVCTMEGLIVGIQVLRLEYYELFSRFYKGVGRAFMPYNKKQNKI
jgi:V-type ATPase 116 kDa subunit